MHRIAVACGLAFSLSIGIASSAAAQNSTQKVRTPPSELAARCGALDWVPSVEEAVRRATSQKEERAARENRIVVYVPTVPRSPMDRQPEVDMYVRSGPFMWCGFMQELQQSAQLVHLGTVPAAERSALVERFGLQPRRFIEPGFLILDADGNELDRIESLSTYSEGWFSWRFWRAGLVVHRLKGDQVPRYDHPGKPYPVFLRDAIQDGLHQLEGRTYLEDREAVAQHADFLASALNDPKWPWPELNPERVYTAGLMSFYLGERERALARWRSVLEKFPDSAFAAKCAAELEGHGPLLRGFEVHYVPDHVRKMLADADGVRGSMAPAGAYDVPQLIDAANLFLGRMQDPDGRFTDSRYDFGGTDSLPNVHGAITATVACADHGWQLAGKEGFPRLDRDALRKQLHTEDSLNLKDTDEIAWARIHRIRALALAIERKGDKPGSAIAERVHLVDEVQALEALQLPSGAYRHEYANPFVTASALVALAKARDVGTQVDALAAAKACTALLRNRTEGGAYSYGQTREGRDPRASISAAAGRMPLCELALLLWQRGSQEALTTALEVAFEHHEQLASVRKYDDHANRLGYGGFFFWFDMQSRVDAIAVLRSGPLRNKLRDQQRELILALPEIDGCFVDSHELGRVYGTAMAHWSLAMLARI